MLEQRSRHRVRFPMSVRTDAFKFGAQDRLMSIQRYGWSGGDGFGIVGDAHGGKNRPRLIVLNRWRIKLELDNTLHDACLFSKPGKY